MPTLTIGPRTNFLYDAEYHLGLVANDSSDAIATANTTKLTNALNANYIGATFQFAHNGTLGPVLYPITFSGKEFFFKGTVKTAKNSGGRLIGAGGRCYPLPSDQYSFGSSGQGGSETRFTRIDGVNGGSMLRIRNHDFRVSGIQFLGKPYLTDISGEGPLTGTNSPIGIEIEGRAAPATGGHTIEDCLIAFCDKGISMRAGYYNDSNVFVSDENHADNGVVAKTNFWSCPSCIYSDNVQAVNWHFHSIRIGGFGGAGLIDMVVCDIKRGGNWYIDGIDITHSKVTLFKVSANEPNDYSHLTADLGCTEMKWDHIVGGSYYLTLFHLSGVDPVYNGTDMSWIKWALRVQGHIAGSDTSPEYDATKLFVLEDIEGSVGVDRTGLLCNVKQLPKTNFTQVNSSPWWYPNSAFRV